MIIISSLVRKRGYKCGNCGLEKKNSNHRHVNKKWWCPSMGITFDDWLRNIKLLLFIPFFLHLFSKKNFKKINYIDFLHFFSLALAVFGAFGVHFILMWIRGSFSGNSGADFHGSDLKSKKFSPFLNFLL